VVTGRTLWRIDTLTWSSWRRRGSAALVLALVVVAVLPLPAVAAPAIAVTPNSGAPGSLITVTGTGFAPGFTPCRVFFDGVEQATCTVGSKGTFSNTFPVPAKAAVGSGLRISACNYCGQGEFEEFAQTTFTVVPPPTTTTTTTTTPGQSTTTTTTTTTTPGQSTTTSTTSTTTPGATTTTVPITDLPPLEEGFGLGSGFFGNWTSIQVIEDQIQLSDDIWLLRCGSPPGATVFDFDDLPTGPRSSIAGLGLTRAPVVEPEHGTITAPKAIRPRTGEGDTNHWYLGTPGDQSYIGLYVGLPEPSAEPVVVRLLGVGSSGGVRDIDEVTLGPNASPAHACLMVRTRGSGLLRGVALKAYTADDVPVDLDVDHIFFDDQPYPVDGEFDRAEMEFIFPPAGRRIDAARPTALLGRLIAPSEVTSREVWITYPNWDRSRMMTVRATTSPARVSADGLTSTSYFWVGGIRIPPGDVQIHATSANPGLLAEASLDLVGTGAPAPPPDVYTESITSVVDILPWSMEVTQAIRGPLEQQAAGSTLDDPFGLVEAKRTVVRGYALQAFPTGAPDRILPIPVTARLYGFRNGVALDGSPLAPANFEYINLYGGSPGAAAEAASRPWINRTWNFLLPYTWTVGDVTLRMVVNPDSEAGHIEEAPGTGGDLNSITRTVGFTNTGQVSAFPALVDFYWQCSQEQIDNGWDMCDGAAVGDIRSAVTDETSARSDLAEWWKVLPARSEMPYYVGFGGVKLGQRGTSGLIPAGPLTSGYITGVSWATLNSAFEELYCDGDSWFPTQIRSPDMRNFAFFLTPPGAPIGGGCAWIGTPTMFRTNLVWPTLSQEAGHTAGLRHSGANHGEEDSRVRWSGDHGQIANPAQPSWGFDTSAMAVIAPASRHVHDYMSYGDWPIWTSVDTWNHMFEALRINGPIGDGRGTAASDPSASTTVAVAVSREGELLLGGSRLGPLPDLTGAEIVEANLFDLAGSPIGTSTAWLVDGGLTHSGAGGTLIYIEIPTGVQVGEVRLPNGLGAATVEITPRLADVDLTVDDERLGLSWTGESEFGFLIEASRDGATWSLIGQGEEPFFEIPLTDLPFDGPGWTIRVAASGGLGVATYESDPVDLGAALPRAIIASPLDGALLLPGMTPTVAGRTTIGGDEAFTYTWWLNGEPMAEGLEATLPLLLAGRHQIGLTVVGPDGSDEATVEVVVITDLDGDGMDDEWEADAGLDPSNGEDGNADPDEDGILNAWEFRAGTDPRSIDTDNDEYADPIELSGGSDPIDPDSIPGFLHGDQSTRAPRLTEMAAQGEEAAPGSTPSKLPLILGGGAVLLVTGILIGSRLRGRRSRAPAPPGEG
jgi:hypothetical protein